uniref:PH domain-containing protein n=1 Tax=Hyaloperonospora arabidopsidis (strain Emoy2) TaxID=559515 RepID=M4BRI3_HYAAE
MSTAFSSRFLHGADTDTTNRGNACVRDVVSDYEDDKYPPGGYIRLNMPQKSMGSNDSPQRYSGSLQRDGTAASRTAADSQSSGNGGAENEKTTDEQSMKPVKPQTFGSLSDGRSSRLISSVQRSARKKWYNDSDEEEDEEKELLAKLTAARKKMAELSKVRSDQEEGLSSDLDSCVERPSAELSGKIKESLVSTPSKQARAVVARNGTDWKESVRTRDSTFDGSGDKAKCSEISAAYDTTQKETNISRLSTKSQTSSLSVVGTENELDRREAKGLIANTVAAGKSTRDTWPTSKQSVSPLSAGDIGTGQPTVVQTGSFGNAPTIIINRRTDRLKHSAGGSEYSGSPRVGPGSNDEVLSPGPRKVPGAFPGRPGSGVLLEGWLRLKQRRGIKGLKKWNSRYFVLHAKSNEVRYYADVVQSAWGTIPLGELGSISLRLIQRIGKLSHPRYKGCHFDITCRNTWGTHYTDDYISSDDEDGSSSNVISANTNGDNTGTTPSKQEKGGTPRSTRVYSLVADSPQVTVAWVNMLDSLLTRSANSPRPEVGSPVETTNTTPVANVGARFKKPVARQRWSALDTESSVLLGPGEIVPRATVYAMNFIFESTPGIETAKFYELEPDAAKLKASLRMRHLILSVVV